MPPSVIFKSIGVDLSYGGEDERVAEMLKGNEKIRVEEIPDPEEPQQTILTFGYQAKFSNVHNKVGLLAQINACKNGIRRSELLDTYMTVEQDIDLLIRGGDIIAVQNNENKDKVLFPRGESFLVELDGYVRLKELPLSSMKMIHPSHLGDGNEGGASGSGTKEDPAVIPQAEKKFNRHTVELDVNPKSQVRRGEAVSVGGEWFRVSSAIREGPLSEQPVRAQAPLTVSAMKDLSQKNEIDGYIRPFDAKQLSLDHDLTDEAISKLIDAKQSNEELIKIAVRSRGTSSAQLLSSNACVESAEKLAAKFVKSMASSSNLGQRRGRNKSSMSSGQKNSAMKQIEEKKAAMKQIEEKKRGASNLHAIRHGCTADVREMYFKTRESIPPPEKEDEIFNMMVKYKLLEPNEPMRRKRMATMNDRGENGKPKKKRYYVNKDQRKTNTHLEGSAIGDALERAMKSQQEGKTVGDGGM